MMQTHQSALRRSEMRFASFSPACEAHLSMLERRRRRVRFGGVSIIDVDGVDTTDIRIVSRCFASSVSARIIARRPAAVPSFCRPGALRSGMRRSGAAPPCTRCGPKTPPALLCERSSSEAPTLSQRARRAALPSSSSQLTWLINLRAGRCRLPDAAALRGCTG